TGATMGRCHGGFCSPELVELFAREYGLRPEEVEKRGAGSYVLASSRPDYLELAGEVAEAVEAEAAEEEAEDAESPFAEEPGVQDMAVDVAIVGAGAAGLAAAKAILAKLPETKIVVLDRAHGAGGIMNQCIHNGFGLHRFGEELSGPEYAFRQVTELADKVDFLFDTTALSIDGESLTLHAINTTGALAIHAKAIVLATGSRERGLGALNIAGDRPSGVFTAGSAQAFVNLFGCLPGKKAVMQGSGDIGLIMARRMALSGMEVMCVYNRSKKPSGLERNIVQCLNDFNIPLITGKNITRLEGKDRLEAVWVADVDPATKQVIPGTDVRVECDTLVLSIGLVPENELAASAGCKVDPRSNGCVVDDTLATNVPGIFACGNAVHIHGLADDASREADAAGINVARFLGADVEAVHVDLDAAAPASVGAAAEAAALEAAGGLLPGHELHNLVCVACPKGCHITAETDADGDVVKVEGYTCKRGLKWAQAEAARPMRVLTVCASVPGALQPLSMRTTGTIPRAMLKDAAAAIYAWVEEGHVEAPVHVGDVIIENQP
ncbi:MAG: FAD-dependent oxidoreductase, partial [Eggerthellaceae bacterium]|nr:FAD-dependent oxidoreductase [Eggerthellaceae bacterium]